MSRLLGIHARPGKWLRRALAILPFVLLIAVYSIASEIRHRDNPSDKLLPSFTQMGQAVERMAFTQDRRSGKYLMPADTLASLKRLFIGILLVGAPFITLLKPPVLAVMLLIPALIVYFAHRYYANKASVVSVSGVCFQADFP